VTVFDRLGARELPTDSTGRVELAVPLGEINIETVVNALTPDQIGAYTLSSAAADEDSIQLTQMLIPSARVITRTIAADGAPLPNVSLTLIGPAGIVLTRRLTDGQGTLTLNAVPVGTFRLGLVRESQTGETIAPVLQAGESFNVEVRLGSSVLWIEFRQ